MIFVLFVQAVEKKQTIMNGVRGPNKCIVVFLSCWWRPAAFLLGCWKLGRLFVLLGARNAHYHTREGAHCS